MSDAIVATAEPHALAVAVPESKFALLRDTYAKGATPQEFELFVAVCNRLRLDPFARQIYAVKRWNSQLRREEMTAQVSIDGVRLAAERTGKYAGQGAPEWCGPDGIWKDVWLQADRPPMAARISVYRKDFTQPITAVALYSEYVQKTKEGSPTKFWHVMPANQLAKCAESLALRKAFPNELSGVYTADEMGQADSEAPKVEPKQERKSTPPPAAEAPSFASSFPNKEWASKLLTEAPFEVLEDYRAWLEAVLKDSRRSKLHNPAKRALEHVSAEVDKRIDVESGEVKLDPIAAGLDDVVHKQLEMSGDAEPSYLEGDA